MGVGITNYTCIFVSDLNNVCLMKNKNEVYKSGILNDTVTLNVVGLKNWLEVFRKTHYKNRPITDHFWNVVYFSKKLGVNVREVLGEEVWEELTNKFPNTIKVFVHPVFEDKDIKIDSSKPLVFDLV